MKNLKIVPNECFKIFEKKTNKNLQDYIEDKEKIN